MYFILYLYIFDFTNVFTRVTCVIKFVLFVDTLHFIKHMYRQDFAFWKLLMIQIVLRHNVTCNH